MKARLPSAAKYIFRFSKIAPFVVFSVMCSGGVLAQSVPDSCTSISFTPVSETRFSTAQLLALKKANLETYRLRDSNRVISFDDGSMFTLTSAREMANEGCNISIETYPTKNQIDPAVSLIFQLLPDGFLTVRSEISPNSKIAKIGKGFPSKERIVVRKADFDQLPESKQQIILGRPHQYKIE